MTDYILVITYSVGMVFSWLGLHLNAHHHRVSFLVWMIGNPIMALYSYLVGSWLWLWFLICFVYAVKGYTHKKKKLIKGKVHTPAHTHKHYMGIGEDFGLLPFRDASLNHGHSLACPGVQVNTCLSDDDLKELTRAGIVVEPGMGEWGPWQRKETLEGHHYLERTRHYKCNGVVSSFLEVKKLEEDNFEGTE